MSDNLCECGCPVRPGEGNTLCQDCFEQLIDEIRTSLEAAFRWQMGEEHQRREEAQERLIQTLEAKFKSYGDDYDELADEEGVPL